MPFLTSVARRKLKFLVNILTAITLLIAPSLAISADKVYRWRLAETWALTFQFLVIPLKTWLRWSKKCPMADS